MEIGLKVKLKTGSPKMTINKVIRIAGQYVEDIEVVWFHNDIFYRERLSAKAVDIAPEVDEMVSK